MWMLLRAMFLSASKIFSDHTAASEILFRKSREIGLPDDTVFPSEQETKHNVCKAATSRQ
jgi:hypothetical protein